jgi:hypothetical protein
MTVIHSHFLPSTVPCFLEKVRSPFLPSVPCHLPAAPPSPGSYAAGQIRTDPLVVADPQSWIRPFRAGCCQGSCQVPGPAAPTCPSAVKWEGGARPDHAHPRPRPHQGPAPVPPLSPQLLRLPLGIPAAAVQRSQRRERGESGSPRGSASSPEEVRVDVAGRAEAVRLV